MSDQTLDTITSLTPPNLKKGEILVGAFLGADGRGHWTVLLPGDKDNVNWKDAQAWAKKQGGDLPDRVEQALLYAQHNDQFEQAAYWSNTQHADDASYAWSQTFDWGLQDNCNVSGKLRARAVRRVPI